MIQPDSPNPSLPDSSTFLPYLSLGSLENSLKMSDLPLSEFAVTQFLSVKPLESYVLVVREE
jgi:hypothetical protein